jgi:hypothetical protein
MIPNSIRAVVLGLSVQLLTLPQILSRLHNPKMWHVFQKNPLRRVSQYLKCGNDQQPRNDSGQFHGEGSLFVKLIIVSPFVWYPSGLFWTRWTQAELQHPSSLRFVVILLSSVRRGLELNFLNFYLQFIFGRNYQVKHVHEESKSICITILNLRILHSVVTVGLSQLSILWVMGMKQTVVYPHSLVVIMTWCLRIVTASPHLYMMY